MSASGEVFILIVLSVLESDWEYRKQRLNTLAFIFLDSEALLLWRESEKVIGDGRFSRAGLRSSELKYSFVVNVRYEFRD